MMILRLFATRRKKSSRAAPSNQNMMQPLNTTPDTETSMTKCRILTRRQRRKKRNVRDPHYLQRKVLALKMRRKCLMKKTKMTVVAMMMSKATEILLLVIVESRIIENNTRGK